MNRPWPLFWATIATVAHVIVGSQLRDLKVQCSRSGLTVHVNFEEPFYGVIYSQDFYQVKKCTYVTNANNGHQSYSFSVPLKGCGTVSQTASKVTARSLSSGNDDLFLENTIVIQDDPDIQELGDTARRLRCVWRHSLQKSVNAKLSNFYKPSMISVKYDHRSVDQVMDVQTGRSPLSVPARGFISSVPNYSSLVVYLKDGGQRFDANVLGCSYANARGELIQLTDEDGCSLRPDLTTPFYKTRENDNPNADVTLYTYFRAAKIPGSVAFTITCNVEICLSRCSDRCRNSRN